MANRKKPISAEEFAAWREDPVTQWVVGEFGKQADLQEAGWRAASWEGGNCDPLLLHELRTRAAAYREIAGVSYDDLAKLEEA